MPSLTFVLPHWAYWLGLILFPLFALHTVRRQRGAPSSGVSLATAYMLWLSGGFIGLHRFYLRSGLGLLYIPLFIMILYGNVQSRQARDAFSLAQNVVLGAKFDLERAQNAVNQGVENASQRLLQAERTLDAGNEQLALMVADQGFWDTFIIGFAVVVLLLLLMDALLLPRLTQRCRETEGTPREAEESTFRKSSQDQQRTGSSPGLAGAIDALNGWVGYFVCYWSVIAVFVYYYEVLARYVFNSPTNWAHEGMFLMFGMQYLVSGGFTLREGGHVRVDVVYLHFSRRTRALIDILTSLFFFLFAGALLWTGWTFAMDAISVWEVSFTEWAIQYWPVKATMALGALLILLQGVSKLIKDVSVFTGSEA